MRRAGESDPDADEVLQLLRSRISARTWGRSFRPVFDLWLEFAHNAHLVAP